MAYVPTGRLARWVLGLQGYHFTIQYRPGKDHSNADARRVYTFPSNLCYHKLRQRNSIMLRIVMTSSDLLCNIWKVGLYLRTHGPVCLQKRFECLRSTSFLNNMFAVLQCWIKSKVSCAQNKRDVYLSKQPLLAVAISGSWEVIATDCMGPLPVTCLGNWYILIVGDHFTKYIKTTALPSTKTAIITQVFLDKIVFRHGPPHRFLSHRGTDLTLRLMTQLRNDLNIYKIFTSSHQP